jgi:hypothetical protein
VGLQFRSHIWNPPCWQTQNLDQFVAWACGLHGCESQPSKGLFPLLLDHFALLTCDKCKMPQWCGGQHMCLKSYDIKWGHVYGL